MGPGSWLLKDDVWVAFFFFKLEDLGYISLCSLCVFFGMMHLI